MKIGFHCSEMSFIFQTSYFRNPPAKIKVHFNNWVIIRQKKAVGVRRNHYNYKSCVINLGRERSRRVFIAHNDDDGVVTFVIVRQALGVWSRLWVGGKHGTVVVNDFERKSTAY